MPDLYPDPAKDENIETDEKVFDAKHGGREVPRGTFTTGQTLWAFRPDRRWYRQIATSPSTYISAGAYEVQKLQERLARTPSQNRERVQSSPDASEAPM